MIIQRVDERFRSEHGGIVSRHCFSAGAHYDPANTHFGPLVGCDEHAVGIGAGFDTHRHAGVVIVSWPLQGTLVHEDGDGRRTEVDPGWVQVLGAGAGIEHSERAARNGPARFLQMTLLADASSPASYVRRQVPAGPVARVLTCPTAAGEATLHVVRATVDACSLPPGDRRFVFVTRGTVQVHRDPEFAEEAITLDEGDSMRWTGGALAVSAAPDAELLLWTLPQPPRPVETDRHFRRTRTAPPRSRERDSQASPPTVPTPAAWTSSTW